jgi:hypothetical protein
MTTMAAPVNPTSRPKNAAARAASPDLASHALGCPIKVGAQRGNVLAC